MTDSSGNSSGSETDLEKVMQNIFSTCDNEGTGQVRVSKLIEFIRPFMQDNHDDFIRLKESLDPENANPEMSREVFFDLMSNWTKEYNQEKSFQNISPSHFDTPCPIVVSTPRASFGARQQLVYEEAAALDMSAVGYDYGDRNMHNNTTEKSVFEEHIKQLAYQNKKYNDELLLARTQLLSQEEHIDSLQKEVERLTKDARQPSEREVNASLTKDGGNNDELRDNTFQNQKCVEKLRKQIVELETKFKNANDDLEHARVKSEEKISRLHEKLSVCRKELANMEAEISSKDRQIIYLEEAKHTLMEKLSDATMTMQNLREDNKRVHDEKGRLADLLRDKMIMQAEERFSAAAAKLNQSLPNLYIVERSGDRKPIASLNDSFEEGNLQEDAAAHFACLASPTTPNLMDELVATLQRDLVVTPSEPSESNALQTRIAELEKELATLNSEKTVLVEKVAQHRDAEDELNAQMAEWQQRYDERVARENELIAQVRDYEIQLIKRNEQIALLRADIVQAQENIDEMVTASHADQSTIRQLRDDKMMLESGNKSLMNRLQNSSTERQRMQELHAKEAEDAIRVYEQSCAETKSLEKQVQELQENIAILKDSNAELSAKNADLYLQKQDVDEERETMRQEHIKLVDIIDRACTFPLPTRQKLKILVRYKDIFNKQNARYKAVVQEKKAQLDANGKMIVELKAKCSMLLQHQPDAIATRLASKSHARVEHKFEKIAEKLDYAEELLKQERTASAALREELAHAQRCGESLLIEKLELLRVGEEWRVRCERVEATQQALTSDVKELLEAAGRLRPIVIKLSLAWKAVFERVHSMEVLLQQLEAVISAEGAGDYAWTGVNHGDVAQTTNDIRAMYCILDALCGVRPEELLVGTSLALRCKFDHLSRPVSPDSPSTVSTVDPLAGRMQEHSTNDDGVESDIDDTLNSTSNSDCFVSAMSEIGEDDAVLGHADALRKMYQLESLELLIHSLSRHEEVPTPDQLAEHANAFVLSHIIDSRSYSVHLRTVFRVLREQVMDLMQHIRIIMLLSADSRNVVRLYQSMDSIITTLFHFSQSAEQYGALKEQCRKSKTHAIMVAYISHLKRQLQVPRTASNLSNLRQEMVLVDEAIGQHMSINCEESTVSDDDDDDEIAAERGRFTALLRNFYPRNLVHTVRHLALFLLVAFFMLYFFVLAKCGDLRVSNCWSRWYDFLAALFERYHACCPPMPPI